MIWRNRNFSFTSFFFFLLLCAFIYSVGKVHETVWSPVVGYRELVLILDQNHRSAINSYFQTKRPGTSPGRPESDVTLLFYCQIVEIFAKQILVENYFLYFRDLSN